MNKDELALEILKLVSEGILKKEFKLSSNDRESYTNLNIEKKIIDAYNYIYKNLEI